MQLGVWEVEAGRRSMWWRCETEPVGFVGKVRGTATI